MNSEEEGKLKASQLEAMQNRNGIDNWPFPQPRGWVAQWDPDGLAQAMNKDGTKSDKLSPDPCEHSDK